MDVIGLPYRLSDEPDLSAINHRLLTGESTLDWSQVKEASLEELRVLLADLDLVEHSDIIGIDSVPGDLAEFVLQAISPEIWEPEIDVERETDPGEVSPYLCKGGGGVERGGDPRGRPVEGWRAIDGPEDGGAHPGEGWRSSTESDDGSAHPGVRWRPSDKPDDGSARPGGEEAQ